ncbi:NAD(P)H-dependent oxidoreductase [Antarcticibacterium sp. 1MA-6-2]|uniref:NADPH-dependent FMN reductase n=1 Tax=Antarcticibacterium sp. 1MA-6-2 TaxID=2908210 RepID=UPI001F25D1BA|nr:NAD(P)H-dependent oxidoreductase [Antarcticibacterium sp. 1MA-6-2]UJH92210.1 NAD(P)H-dependent oxidoreductase [Antarcticibacterium sp. 1MA-6-2]
MKKILAFAGSNSSTSINHTFLTHVVDRIQGHEIKILKLREFDIPIYSIDLEKERGIPTDIRILKNLIDEHDALVISVNEHNGTVSAFFKNIIDWLSRMDRSFLTGKHILLMSTSPGARGAAAALDYTKHMLPRFGGKIIQSFSFPSFKDNLEDGKIQNEVLDMGIEDVLTTFAHEIED